MQLKINKKGGKKENKKEIVFILRGGLKIKRFDFMSNLFIFKGCCSYRTASILPVYTFLGATPTCLSTTSPFLKTKTVGMFLTPYFAANS